MLNVISVARCRTCLHSRKSKRARAALAAFMYQCISLRQCPVSRNFFKRRGMSLTVLPAVFTAADRMFQSFVPSPYRLLPCSFNRHRFARFGIYGLARGSMVQIRDYTGTLCIRTIPEGAIWIASTDVCWCGHYCRCHIFAEFSRLTWSARPGA